MEHTHKIKQVEIRNLQISDYEQLSQSFTRVYSDGSDVFWTREQIEKLLEIFPDGQIVAVVDNKIIGCALSIIVDYDKVKNDHTYEEVTGNETFDTHNPAGNILYGIEIFIHPDYRGLRLGRRMYDYRKELCESLNLKAIMFGGRIPNYHKYADTMRPKEYIQQIKKKKIFDPVLTFQLSNDFHVRKVMTDYLPNDEESKHYATLLQWDNIYYTAPTKEFKINKTTVRLGLVQWQMRPYQNIDDVFEQVEFFVDAVSDYKSDFVLFPEYFNAPLMARFNNMNESEAIRELAKYTKEMRDRFINLAISYNINIITGSMPFNRDGNLYNVGFLCRRDGSYEMYEKVHITPDEIKSWGLSGGKMVKTFDTDCAKIGILICYDVEFPELSRIMADQGMQILFVPFLTDTQNGYSRVRVCAQARAIENECFVAIAGCVGNLPRVHNMDIQYAQSGVFTPCDFAFPTDGRRAEATPNTEMILISDVDLDLLNELHTYGSVRNLKDRRNDLYELKLKKK
ncbi:bifunctional GNAT family N-acetyltransferase/carbon-nitrogen hydrolase family protein [Parabacteroides pacaensis]|uniref:bifunctional GNAT family N-acetyltransferase/carbon-nitrogen hydrolase family protein n=1 Tax=Parabacteroides pacaensis TaxID=2086575 RepID=UPI000D0FBD37|nr:bifunctional GNAT family N-acetyltransferase/carbon-nitrogen hydrolase family protein [Parabacteroides pacaensis]